MTSENIKSEGRLHRKVALITGSSRGIGRAIALGFAREGADVVVTHLQNPGKARDVVRQVEQLGSKVLLCQMDVRDPAQVAETVKQALVVFGTIDILVNNAGINIPGMFHKIKDEDWRHVIDVNLYGVYHCTRAVLPHMREKACGRIINLASVLGEMGDIGTSNYVASKAAVIGLTKALAREVALKGITVNAIAAGYITTEMTASLDEEIKKQIVAQIPLKQFGAVEDVVEAAIYLAAESGKYLTGQTLRVNGGLYM